MYTPPLYREDDLSILHDLIEAHGFGLLVSMGTNGLQDGLQATHLPFLLDRTRGPRGTLRAHMARANPHWEAFAHGSGRAGEVLVVFRGPHAYISPRWYEDPRGVPTWNYVAVHAYGRATVVDAAALPGLIDELVAHHEQGRAKPWRMDELQPARRDALLAAIVGFEIEITRLVGKRKLGQNRSAADRAGAVAGLRAAGDPGSLDIAALMDALER